MNIILRRVILSFILFIGLLFIGTHEAYAIKFDLIQPEPPTGGFKRGDVIKFSINVNTQGESVTSTEIGVSFKSTDLEYQSTEPGNTLSSITGQNTSGQGLIIKGSSSGGFSGTGTYAYVNFKIVAEQSGSTQLCTLFTPAGPTYPPNVPTPTGVINKTTNPTPSALPKTGNNLITLGFGAVLLMIIPSFYILFTNRLSK